MKLIRNIPNAITCGNLICGCLAVVCVFDGDLNKAAYLVGIALILDFLDGFFARLLKVSSPIGKDLDSLADMVTFGVVPGMVMYKLLEMVTLGTTSSVTDPGLTNTINPDQIINYISVNKNYIYTTYFTSLNDNVSYSPWLKYMALMIPVFSGVRLARFNNDSRQSDSFIGLPTPANAMFICSIPLIISLNFPLSLPFLTTILNPYFLICSSLIFSLLLVAELPLIALKFKTFAS